MRKTKISQRIVKLILREKKRNPLWGCRKLSKLLKDKYSLFLSKSLINKVLNSQGIKERVGRKSEIGFLKRKSLEKCGLFFLRVAELEICFPKILLGSLGIAFPRLSEDELVKLADFFIYAQFFNIKRPEEIKDSNRSSLWRIVDSNHPLSLKRLKNFFEKFKKEDFHLLLAENLIKHLREVYALKITLGNNFSVYIDPEFRSLWADSSSISECFFLPFIRIKEKLTKILEGSPLIVMGIPCFGKFPSYFVQFLRSLPWGIKSLEILGKEKQVLEKITSLSSLDFILGFLPQELINKGGIQKTSRLFKLNIPGLGEEVYVEEFKIKSLQPIDIKELKIRFVLIKRAKKSPPCWALLTNTNLDLKKLLEVYSLYWPYLEESFSQHLKIVESFSFKEFSPLLEEKVSSFKFTDSNNFFINLGEFLKDYLYRKYFLGRNNFLKNWEEIFNLQGRISKKTPGFLKVFLNPSSKFPPLFLEELLFSINQANIFWKERKLIFFFM